MSFDSDKNLADRLASTRCLVTGGAGFIGSHLVDRLLGLGCRVCVIDNLATGSEDNLDAVRSQIEFACLDITHFDETSKVISDFAPDVVFHLAVLKARDAELDPLCGLLINTGGTLSLLMAAQKARVHRFVHVSTGSVYGLPLVTPVMEQHPKYPTGYYGVSKLAAECYVNLFTKKGLYTTIVRPFHVYGPRQACLDTSGGVVGIFCRRALEGKPLVIHGDGEQVRSFTYVSDIVDCLVLAAVGQSIGRSYIAASGLSISINRLASDLEVLLGRECEREFAPARGYDIRDCTPSHDAIAALGKHSWVDFQDGLKMTLDWYKARYGAL